MEVGPSRRADGRREDLARARFGGRLVPARGTRRPKSRPEKRPGQRKKPLLAAALATGATGLEPATSGVTGRRSNQLSYAPGRTAVYEPVEESRHARMRPWTLR